MKSLQKTCRMLKSGHQTEIPTLYLYKMPTSTHKYQNAHVLCSFIMIFCLPPNKKKESASGALFRDTLQQHILTFFPLTGGCSEGLGAFRFFFKHINEVFPLSP